MNSCKHTWKITDEKIKIGCGKAFFDDTQPHGHSAYHGCVYCGNPKCGEETIKPVAICKKCSIKEYEEI